jgi:hypothetical protein
MILADPMLWRLVWKEYRAQRSFWLAIAGCAIGLMFLFKWLLRGRDGLDAPWVIALSLPLFFALGSSAVAFASEREEGTIDLLRILAARTSRVFLGKVAVSLAGTVAMWALLLAIAWIATWGQTYPAGTGILLSRDGIMTAALTMQLLAWGFVFSLSCRKVLTAVCLTGVVSPLSAALAFELVQSPPLSGANSVALVLCVPPLLALAYLLTARLMSGRSWNISLPRLKRRRKIAADALERLAGVRETAPVWRRTFTRLLWVEFRNLVSVGHILWITGLLVGVFIPLQNVSGPNPASAMMGVVLSSLLTGVWTFHAEGGKRTRFLADHGLSPTAIWLTKQVVSVLLLIVVAVPFLAGVAVANQNEIKLFRLPSSSVYHSDVPGASAVGFAATLVCLGYAVGQFASMLIRRSVTAAFIGAVLYAVLGSWTWLMFEFRVPLLVSAVPVLLILLATTFVWSRHWLLEQATWRSWRRLALALGAALAAAWGVIGLFRIYEVPHPAILGNIAALREFQGRPITAEEAATADLYRQALRGIKWDSAGSVGIASFLKTETPVSWEQTAPQKRQWLDLNRDVLRTCLAATERPNAAFNDPTLLVEDLKQGASSPRELTLLPLLVLLSARELESQGNLDEALNRYVAALRLSRHIANRGSMEHWVDGIVIEEMVVRWIPAWSDHPDQTPERMEAGFSRIHQEVFQFPALRDALLTQQFMVRRILQGDWSEIIGKQYPPGEVRVRTVINVMERMFPWERHRSMRVLDLFDASQLHCLDVLEFALLADAPDLQQRAEFASAVPDDRASIRQMINQQHTWAAHAAGVGWPQQVDGGDFFDAVPNDRSREERIPWNWVSTTPLLKIVLPPDHSRIWQARLHRELTVRIMLLKLKLAADKKAHGEYPDLGDIANRYQIAIDPYAGTQFGFRPQGYPTAVHVVNGWTHTVERVDAGQPILWSAGPANVRRFAPIPAEAGIKIDQGVVRLDRLPSPVAFTLP